MKFNQIISSIIGLAIIIFAALYIRNKKAGLFEEFTPEEKAICKKQKGTRKWLLDQFDNKVQRLAKMRSHHPGFAKPFSSNEILTISFWDNVQSSTRNNPKYGWCIKIIEEAIEEEKSFNTRMDEALEWIEADKLGYHINC